jgi:hypothetical protein
MMAHLPDGSQMGPFYELETSSPAADIEPGDTLTHEHATFHFCGSKDAVRANFQEAARCWI